MSTAVTIRPTKGMVNRRAVLGDTLNSFQSLVNCRLTRGGDAIEQTPGWLPANPYTAGTYYSAGSSHSEPVDSSSSLYVSLSAVTNFQAGRYAARSGITQIQVIKQTVVPAGETIYTGCLLVVNDYTALGMALNGTLVVTMASATTFNYTLNGGAPVGPLAVSTTGVSIEAGDATLYFLANAGYAGTESWTWRRSDWFDETSGPALLYDWPYTINNSQVYFADYSGRIMLYENGGVRSVGYRPVYGTHVSIFEDHLYVANYSTSIFTSTTFTAVMGNSDLGDFDDFIQTDVNEADTFMIPAGVLPSGARPINKICGLYKRNTVLYIVTTSAIWSNQYVGLPNVNDYNFLFAFPGSSTVSRPIETEAGVYFISTTGVSFFDGTQLTEITDDIRGMTKYFTAHSPVFPNFTTFMLAFSWGGYDNLEDEIYFFYNGVSGNPAACKGFFVYQETNKTWYFRAMNLVDSVAKTMSMNSGRLIIPISLGVAFENTSYYAFVAGVLDGLGGTYQQPFIETQDITFDEVQIFHEIESFFLDAWYGDVESPFNTTSIKVDAAVRTFAMDTVTYANVATFDKTQVDGTLPYRASAHIFRFKIYPTVANGAEYREFLFNRLTFNVRNLAKQEVRR